MRRVLLLFAASASPTATGKPWPSAPVLSSMPGVLPHRVAGEMGIGMLVGLQPLDREEAGFRQTQ